MSAATVAGMEDVTQHLDHVRQAIAQLDGQPNVRDYSRQELREAAERHSTKTTFGNYAFGSMVKSRSAPVSLYVGSAAVRQSRLAERQATIQRHLATTLTLVHNYIKRAPLARVRRRIGNNNRFSPLVTAYVSVAKPEILRTAYAWGQTLADADHGVGPQQYEIYIPEWQEKDRQVLIFPEIQTTYVLGIDYIGEMKMAHLRLAMFSAKQQGLLGLHAGSKVLRARDARTGTLQRLGMILFGLTATGKTTHTCHDHGLTGAGEGIDILQDDIVLMCPDASCLGTERGFYLKTDNLTAEQQPLIHHAVTRPHALLENVFVDHQRQVDFADETLSSNGRAVILREDMGAPPDTLDLPPADALDKFLVAFITRRNTVVPIVSKLTMEQAAAIFMLGESIESSGGDPRRAGESVRTVGMNPFVIGSPAEEGNRFFDFIRQHPDKIECYLLNTGGVGEIRETQPDGSKVVTQHVTRVEIPEMASIIRGIARNTITWVPDAHFGMQVPQAVDGVRLERFALRHFYSAEQINQLVAQLKEERRAHLQQFPELHSVISNALA